MQLNLRTIIKIFDWSGVASYTVKSRVLSPGAYTKFRERFGGLTFEGAYNRNILQTLQF